MTTTTLWPFVPTNPPAWRELQKRWPVGLGYIGHDGERFHFQETGNPEPVLIPMTRRARRIAREG